jgi:hypothetical protein
MCTLSSNASWGSSINTVSDYRLNDRGSIPGREKSFSSSGQSMMLTTHLYLTQRSRMGRSYIPLPFSACMACSRIFWLFGAGVAQSVQARWPGFDPWHRQSTFPLASAQTCSEAHPVFYPMGIWILPCWEYSAARAWWWPLTPIQCRGQEWGAVPPHPP